MPTLFQLEAELTRIGAPFSKTAGLAKSVQLVSKDLDIASSFMRGIGQGVDATVALKNMGAASAISITAPNMAGMSQVFGKGDLSAEIAATLAHAETFASLDDALKLKPLWHGLEPSIMLGSTVAGLGTDVHMLLAPFGEGVAKSLAATMRATAWFPTIDDSVLRASLGPLPEFVRWAEARRRRRVEMWLRELGSGDDPATVELVEVDGSEYGRVYSAFRYAYLGQRVASRPGDDEAHCVPLADGYLYVWVLRIYRDGLDTFLEIRYPPWGTGVDGSIQRFDLFRHAKSSRILGGLGALGYGRRRGRKGLADVWEQSDFHRRYLEAKARATNPQPGRPPRQLDIAGVMGISEKHLRNIIRLHGLPDENVPK